MKNGKLKIEKVIPIPSNRKGRGSGRATFLRSLKIGESVFLPMIAPLASSAASYSLGSGNYAVRAEKNGARVWRTK